MKSSIFFVVLIILFIVSFPVAFALGITSTMIMAAGRGAIRYGQIIQQMIGGVDTIGKLRFSKLLTLCFPLIRL